MARRPRAEGAVRKLRECRLVQALLTRLGVDALVVELAVDRVRADQARMALRQISPKRT